MDNAPQKPRNWVRIILVLSLALNIAVIGIVAGLALSGTDRDGRTQRMSVEFGALGHALDRDDKRAVADKMRRGGPRPMSKEAMRAQVTAFAETLRTDPFDADQATLIIANLRSRSLRLQENAQTAFVAHLATMSLDQREALADRLEQGRR